MPSRIPVLVTHSGAFHSDELMALVLLEQFVLGRPVRVANGLSQAQAKRLIEGETAPKIAKRWTHDGIEDCRTPCPILRTRDPKTLELAKASKHAWVLDVGGEYQPEKLNFDHHQESMKEQWLDGTPYSCAGLVWRWIRENEKQAGLDEDVADEVGESLIRRLDAHDNGVEVFPAAVVCEGFNRNQIDEDEATGQFEKALGLMGDVLANHIHKAQAKVRAREMLKQAWSKAAHGQRYVVLSDPMDYPDGTGLLKEVSGGQALLLGLPGKNNRYNLISTSLAHRFDTACPVPEAWRGRMDFQVHDQKGAICVAFAHKTGFMCVLEGGAEEAARVAELVLADHQGARS